MAGFLYFADGLANPLTDAVINRLGLTYACDGQSPMFARLEGRTPSGGVGTLIADEARLAGKTFGYLPADQDWRIARVASDTAGAVYVGCYRDARPTPRELARREQLPGQLVKLADGQQWLVPRLRFFDGEHGFRTAMPVLFDVDDAGQWMVGGMDEQYRELDAIAQRMLDGMLGGAVGSTSPLTTGEALQLVTRLLRQNYVVSAPELGRQMLGALSDDGTLVEAMHAAMDFQTASEWVEKKSAAEHAGSPIVAGGAEDSSTTGPLVRT